MVYLLSNPTNETLVAPGEMNGDDDHFLRFVERVLKGRHDDSPIVMNNLRIHILNGSKSFPSSFILRSLLLKVGSLLEFLESLWSASIAFRF